MTMTDAQRATLDRYARDGWRRAHQTADGDLLIRRTTHHRGSRGIGVSLPGPFWSVVGGSSAHSTTKQRTIRPDGTVPEEAQDQRSVSLILMGLGAFFLLSGLTALFLPMIGLGAFFIWAGWMAR